MSIKDINTRVARFIEHEGREYPVPAYAYEPEGVRLVVKDDSTIVYGGLAHHPFLCDGPLVDYSVRFASRRRNSTLFNENLTEWAEAEEADGRVVEWLDVYEHGGVTYSLAGGGPQCRFDTARKGAALSYDPNELAPQEIERLLGAFNEWANGNVYEVWWVEVQQQENEEYISDPEMCSLFYGSDEAWEWLVDEVGLKEEAA